MNHRFLFFIAALLSATCACSFPDLSSVLPQSLAGSGNVITMEETISDFDSVDISSSFDVRIMQGEAYQVVIWVDDNLVDHFQVRKQGSTLEIGLKPGISLVTNATLQAEVSMPDLTVIKLSGASDAKISGFKSSQSLTVDLSGSSSLRGDIEAGDTTFGVSGSSDANLTGTGGNLKLDASGSSDVDLSGFPVSDADLNISGASSVSVNPGGILDVKASGASDVIYLGNPILGNINTSGSSRVEAK